LKDGDKYENAQLEKYVSEGYRVIFHIRYDDFDNNRQSKEVNVLLSRGKANKGTVMFTQEIGALQMRNNKPSITGSGPIDRIDCTKLNRPKRVTLEIESLSQTSNYLTDNDGINISKSSQVIRISEIKLEVKVFEVEFSANNVLLSPITIQTMQKVSDILLKNPRIMVSISLGTDLEDIPDVRDALDVRMENILYVFTQIYNIDSNRIKVESPFLNLEIKNSKNVFFKFIQY